MELFVTKLNNNTQVEDLKLAFGKFGTLQNVEIPTDKNGRSKGYGFVSFLKEAEAEAALESLNGSLILDQCIFVKKVNSGNR